MTLTASGQLSGVQDRNFDFNYVIDLAKVASSDDLEALAGDHPDLKLRKVAGTPARDRDCGPAGQTRDVEADETYSDGLAGDLELGETLRNGLDVIETASQFNIYGTSGPDAAQQVADVKDKADNVQAEVADALDKKGRLHATPALKSALAAYSLSLNTATSVAPALSQGDRDLLSAQLQDNTRQLSLPGQTKSVPASVAKAVTAARDATQTASESVKSGAPSVASATAAPPPPKQAGSQTTMKFGSTIEFNVMLTAGAGPNWALKDFKGPSGSPNLLSGSRAYVRHARNRFRCDMPERTPG